MKKIITSSETNKNFRRRAIDFIDFKTIGIVILLISAGLLSLYSTTYEASSIFIFYKQLIFTGIGFGILLFVLIIPENWIKFNSVLIYIISIALLIGVLFFGKTVSGTQGWFQIANFSFQPAEFAKIATLLLVSRFLSQKGIDIKNLRDLLTVLAMFALPTTLIILQPDMGSASVLIVLLLGVLFWVGFDLLLLYFIGFIPFVLTLPLLGVEYFIGSVFFFSITAIFFRKNLLKTLTLIALIFAIGYFSTEIIRIMPQNTQDRIETFLHPESDPLNKGYNVMQSVLAVGSGGFSGKGYLKGSQTQLRYIPEQRTDFIFCVPTEEFGFIGGIIVIGLYILLVLRILTIAKDLNNQFFSILSFGIAITLLYHAIVNIGMVLRLIPVMGIPLPFMSYGGTALIVNLIMVALLLKAYSSQKKNY
ncbi:FtsW/RodA/SpoVE family cell cycle protein [Bacteroidota bacterium]